MTSVIDDEMKLAVLDSKRNRFIEMRAGSDQKGIKEGNVMQLAGWLCLILGLELSQQLNLAPTFQQRRL